jgi:hypothetical protein
MSEHLAFIELVAEPVQRRCWLLYRALDCLPLDQAIDWAQRADDFIVHGRAEPRTGADAIRPEPAAVAAPRRSEPRIELPAAVVAAPNPVAAAPSARATISPEQRQRLIDRLATGAKNTDLAAEFGLTAKQVQGVRIGCGREIAARRSEAAPRLAQEPPAAAPSSPLPASVDEVVRFLRQQDDVVVPQASGEFLVNARFRLQFDELVSRANRIRARQGKPEFAVANGANGHPAAQRLAATNGHVLAKVA